MPLNSCRDAGAYCMTTASKTDVTAADTADFTARLACTISHGRPSSILIVLISSFVSSELLGINLTAMDLSPLVKRYTTPDRPLPSFSPCSYTTPSQSLIRTPLGTPSPPAFTTTTWFSAGWRAGLSVFGIKVNSWWRYCIVLAFQISRSILGSLLTNIFRPHLTVKVQTIGTGRKALTRSETNAVVAAQASWNIFGFVASLSDSFLMLSQIDLSIITLVVTMLADSQSTYFIGEVDAKRTDTGSDCNSLNPTSVGSLKLKD